MKKWRVGTIGETELLIHPAVLIFLVYSWITGHLVFVLLSLLSILLHESAHAAIAMLCGLPLRCIELTPLGATLRMEDQHQIAVLRRFSILIAGPLMSCLLCWLAVWLAKKSSLDFEVCRLLFVSNLGIVMINLLPVYPLDGGRILALVLEYFFPKHTANRTMRITGMIIGGAMIGLNLVCSWKLGGWNYSLALAGCCMIYSAQTESCSWSMWELRGFMDRKINLETKGHMPLVWVATMSNTKVRDLVRRLPHGRMAAFLCIEPGSMKCLGWLTECEIIQCYLNVPASDVQQVLRMSHNPK